MTSTMPRAKKTVVEPKETTTEAQPTGPRMGTFKNYEGKDVSVELVDLDSFLWTPGAKEKKPLEDYFFNTTDKPIHDVIPKYQLKNLGAPCMSEMMNDIFYEYFKPEDGFLLYKKDLEEVYLVIIPLKFTQYSKNKGNVTGDMQIHAVSFMHYGSVNIDLFKNLLEKVTKTIGYKK
jgi:hypothetical protein